MKCVTASELQIQKLKIASKAYIRELQSIELPKDLRKKIQSYYSFQTYYKKFKMKMFEDIAYNALKKTYETLGWEGIMWEHFHGL